MLVYLTVIILILAFRLSLGNYKGHIKARKEKLYCRIIYSILILLAALRYIIPESDGMGYVDSYTTVNYLSFNDIIQTQVNPGYFILSKLFTYTTLSYHFWFGFLELIYIFAISRIISKFSNDKLFSILLFFTIGLYSFSFNGLKQLIAMSFAWLAFVDFYEKKYKKAILLFIIAFFCHKTVLIFLMAAPIYFLIDKRKYYIYIAGISAIILLFYSPLLSLMTVQLGEEHYLSYIGNDKGSNVTTLFFYLLLFFIAIFAGKHNESLNRSDHRLITGLSSLATFSQIFALFVASAFRLSLYFSPFMLVLIPNSLSRNKNLRLVVIFLVSFWFFYTGRHFPYKFFWQ